MFLGIIFGIILYAVAIPIIGQGVELVCTIIEYAKMKFHYKIAKIQKEIEKISVDENIVSYPIGFQMSSEEEYYDEEDDD